MEPEAPTSVAGPAVPAVTPQRIVEDTWLVPNLAPAGPDVFLPVNTMVIRGDQPIVVDTGAPVHRDSWFDQVFTLVDPGDVRWIYLTHDDGDPRTPNRTVTRATPPAARSSPRASSPALETIDRNRHACPPW